MCHKSVELLAHTNTHILAEEPTHAKKKNSHRQFSDLNTGSLIFPFSNAERPGTIVWLSNRNLKFD